MGKTKEKRSRFEYLIRKNGFEFETGNGGKYYILCNDREIFIAQGLHEAAVFMEGFEAGVYSERMM